MVMIDYLVNKGADIFEIGLYSFLYEKGKNKNMQTVHMSKNEIRKALSITYERLNKTLRSLTDKYGVIKPMGSHASFRIRLIPPETAPVMLKVRNTKKHTQK
jgi:hypothetical protein